MKKKSSALPYQCPFCEERQAIGPEHVNHVNRHRMTPADIVAILRRDGYHEIADLLEQS